MLNRILYVFLSMMMLVFTSCFMDLEESAGRPLDTYEDKKYDGFIHVEASSHRVRLGTIDASAPLNERPVMNVRFTYDFSMSKHEVTREEYAELMDGLNGFSYKPEKDSLKLPVSNITYYDAVLYANEKSKKEGLDTAYFYVSADFDEEGHCISLNGFDFQAKKKGFRLPTEAEWTFAASRDWNSENGWNNTNAKYRAHGVCEKDVNELGFCDMTGNVMEWVNDWMGFFEDTTLYDFVGAPDGGNIGRRALKGGSYQSSPNSVKLYSRNDVYTVTSSTKAPYVGFRLAIGKVESPTWLSYGGKAVESRVVLLTTAAALRQKFNTFRSKMVFRNDQTNHLQFVDFSNSVLSVQDIDDTLDAYHPVISPNGLNVAFSTGMEGVSGKSNVYVRILSDNSKIVKKLNVENASIPRWRVLPNGDTAIVYVTNAGSNDDANWKKTSTWQVPFNKGTFGKPEKLFDGAYHGGISDDNRLAVTGSKSLRARIADPKSTVMESATDTVWYNGEQACNVSLAMDGSKKTLFIDFGGKTGQEFTGEDYETHKMLLVVDSLGNLENAVPAPSGYTFDHTEWVDGSSRFAVATLTNSKKAHPKIVLVDLADSSVTDIGTGDELWHPYIWKNNWEPKPSKVELDADSAGAYLLPGSDDGDTYIRYNMQLLWEYADSANVVILGSSRPLAGVDPLKFSNNYFAINLSQTPNSIYYSRDYFENYVLGNVPKLRYLVVSLDIDFWNKKDDENDNFWVSDYKKYPGYVYDKNHDYWKDGIPENLLGYTKTGMGVKNSTYYLRNRGTINASEGYWQMSPEIENDSNWYDKNEDLMDSSFEAFESILELAKKSDVQVVGVIFPQNPGYRQTGAFGRYGLRRTVAYRVVDRLKKLEKSYPNFHLFDENKMGDHDYSHDMASDDDHLTALGANQMTYRLDSLFKSLE